MAIYATSRALKLGNNSKKDHQTQDGEGSFLRSKRVEAFEKQTHYVIPAKTVIQNSPKITKEAFGTVVQKSRVIHSP